MSVFPNSPSWAPNLFNLQTCTFSFINLFHYYLSNICVLLTSPGAPVIFYGRRLWICPGQLSSFLSSHILLHAC